MDQNINIAQYNYLLKVVQTHCQILTLSIKIYEVKNYEIILFDDLHSHEHHCVLIKLNIKSQKSEKEMHKFTS